ncbi:MAG: DNA polymerase III subunit beta [Actinobacteria bacterium]|nr:DNA polymerase III subunit beta [Actinomycetota bacterium]
MLIKILKSELEETLRIATRAVSSRTALPILTGISIEAQGDKLKIRSTDLEISVEATVPSTIEEEGVVVVPAKPFYDLVRKLEEGIIYLKSDFDGTELSIEAENNIYKFRTLPPGDFPQGVPVPEGKKIVLNGDDMIDAIKKTSRSASKDESRVVLTGVHFESGKNSITVAATDSYRLSVVTVPCNYVDEGIEFLVPVRALDELSKIIENDELEIVVTEKQIFVLQGNWVFYSKLIDGQFPAYKQLFPEKPSVEVTVEKEKFVNAIDRIASVFKVNAITMEIEEENMKVYGHSSDYGEAMEKISVKSTGNIKVAFNQQYLLDGVRSINADLIRIELQEGLNPAVIRPLDGEEYSYLLMPIKS